MFFYVYIAFATYISVGNTTPIIEGNYVTTPDVYPYLARLIIITTLGRKGGICLKGQFLCSGIIVKTNVILTAAHCLADTLNEPDVTVRTGLVNTKQKGQITKMIKYKIHQQFDDTTNADDDDDESETYYPNDLALIWLNEHLVFTRKVQPAKLNDGTIQIHGKVGKVIGWGFNGVDTNCNELKEVEMQVTRNKYCEPKIRARLVNAFCVLCAKKKSAPFTGDSGGPFVLNGVVVGLSSWGLTAIEEINGKEMELCDASNPSVYVKIDAYMEWIKNSIEDESEESANDIPLIPIRKGTKGRNFARHYFSSTRY